MVVLASGILGFPRMGWDRDLKHIVEKYWTGEAQLSQLLSEATRLRRSHWNIMKQAGVSPNFIPSNDFSFYDSTLDLTHLFQAIPQRYQPLKLPSESSQPADSLRLYFAMARGFQSEESKIDVPAMEMKKWFDTNYHFIVPEIPVNTAGSPFFSLPSSPAHMKPVADFVEATRAGVATRPVILGPVSYLYLSKLISATPLSPEQSLKTKIQILLNDLIPAYVSLLNHLAAAGAEWIQFDEPALVMDLNSQWIEAYQQAYQKLRSAIPASVKIFVATYFGSISEHFPWIFDATKFPIQGLHIDCVRGPAQLAEVQKLLVPGNNASSRPVDSISLLSLGVIDGRNIWKTDLTRLVDQLEPLVRSLESTNLSTVCIAPSCSLLHVPHSLERETRMDPEIKNWLAFAVEKLSEVVNLTRIIDARVHGLALPADIAEYLRLNQAALESRRTSPKIHSTAVQSAVAGIHAKMSRRESAEPIRRAVQAERFKLPSFPTTTIGSFPQTPEVRAARAKFRSGNLSKEEYEKYMEKEIRECIEWQEKVGLDVLVHGEFERTDMVEAFGEMLAGYVFSKFGWVQSYGSRCVKPPILYGDIRRNEPMTVRWSRFAQSCTTKPIKGMLTGPVTCLAWSFVRDDQPRKITCQQLALALREEVVDLEAAGVEIIQVDEAAIRELLPLRLKDRDEYLQWAVECFRLTTCGVKDKTQIHTHMCYSDFQDMLHSLVQMDADVTTIENSRSDLKLLQAFSSKPGSGADACSFPFQIGPGVYDIHSPRVPSVEEMVQRAQILLQYIPAGQLWINPDCGLKTRKWKEVKQALENMVHTANQLRSTLRK